MVDAFAFQWLQVVALVLASYTVVVLQLSLQTVSITEINNMDQVDSGETIPNKFLPLVSAEADLNSPTNGAQPNRSHWS